MGCETCVYWHGRCEHPIGPNQDGVNGSCDNYDECILDEFED